MAPRGGPSRARRPDLAREAWRAGIAAARRAGAGRWADSLSYIGLIELDLERPDEIEPLLQEALSRYPDHPQLLWLHGQALVRDGRFADAVPVFEDLVAWRSRPRTTDGLLGIDERLFDFLPYERLATCCFRLGRYTEAERYFALAERWEPGQLEYKVKRAALRQARPC